MNNSIAGESLGKDGKPVFAFVTIDKLILPSVEQIRSDISAVLPDGSHIDKIEVDNDGATFSVNGYEVIVTDMKFPIPWKDLEGPCASSWIWPEATTVLKKHKSHLVVVLTGKNGTHLERNVLLTKLLSAMTTSFSGTGTYWGHGNVVLSPELIHEMAAAASVEEPPVLLWVNFHRFKSSNNALSLVTEGLEYFDCMNIEIIDSEQSAEKILDLAIGLAYICLRGDRITDGDTVGFDNDGNMKIPTKHVPSVRDNTTMVIRVGL
ncbi:DUF4261 domain-containing protein [Bythopirellula goksoeyrii]|uniref:DUF4261 domain-containing protein n=1 Tax=Bythopirellula goksoeyrii TaxID=1400387 RepID=A0A5B9QGA7_9BACT|nr:DUF4261 domain-containing protein [Bythopirellula goksoeyrii]QEG33381.1 hypothetical protein Pr1d_06420 [Bythopirellula goksoeyrii]